MIYMCSFGPSHLLSGGWGEGEKEWLGAWRGRFGKEEGVAFSAVIAFSLSGNSTA